MFPRLARLLMLACGIALACPAAQADDCHGDRDFCATASRYAMLLRLPGYAVAVARNGKLVHWQSGGYADTARQTPIRPDSIFPVASITKTFTAAMMMQYVEEGRIRLDDAIADYPQVDNAAAWPWSSPDIRIRHVLSQTSEGAKPGTVFSYNGNRYNAVYGVFAKLAGEKDYARAFADRIGLADTSPGWPDDAADPRIARIVTPYRYDRERKTYIADDDLTTGHRHAYPNSGMLSTANDLARYADALDRGLLVGKAGDAAMTTPFTLNDGTASPYALGWFSERWNGRRLAWVYGLGPSYSSFLLRVPGERLCLIFLANTDAPTASLRLNYGGALQFPLAAPFLRRYAKDGKALPELPLDADAGALEARIARLPPERRVAAFTMATGIAATWNYVEKKGEVSPGNAAALIAALQRIDPGWFRALHPELAGTMADIAAPGLLAPMNELAAAYSATGRIDPRISQDFADYYDRTSQDESAARQRAALVAAPGYDTNDATILARFALGDRSFRAGDVAAGREHYWKGIRDAVLAGWSPRFADRKREQMNALTREHAATP